MKRPRWLLFPAFALTLSAQQRPTQAPAQQTRAVEAPAQPTSTQQTDVPAELTLARALEIALGNSTNIRTLAGIGIGVTIATVSKSQQAQLLTFFVNPPITLLSGSTSPIENMPPFFQKLSLFDPLRYLVIIVRGVTLKNAPWSALWPNLAILAMFGEILFLFSAWRFRKQ
jgi:hypothetical protein